MRAIWKGAVSFGLVNVPVRLYSATENHDVQFRQVHVADGGRIRYKRVCSIDGDEVAYDDIAKGYETEDGEMVVLTDEDFADLPTRSSKEISVEKFVPSDQIDPIYFDKTYYLEPDKSAVKPYVLLRDALEGEDRMAVATVAIRTRMTLAVLRVREGMIVMQTMLWPDEVRDAGAFGDLGADEKATEKEMSMAQVLIDQLADDFEPDDYEDDYALAVKELVRAKVEGGEVRAAPEEEDEGGEVVDLLAALAKSVERAKTRRGESSSATSTDGGSKGSSESGAKGSGATKTTAKKTTAKKSAAKKAPAKKTAAKTTSSKSTAKKSAPKKKAG
ncbi:Ku protein [Janibacter melonis]|uniref:Non-homologous end joining protein Ku n=1 Tax=Janibacter melonis TaxID=262209 RepID=A0A176QD27_9MICO|nr:Ku protein [Janibacter melonis]OAB87582.1 Ku protein [Janibacter melonis]